jgi:hypothetical protein
VWQALRSSGTAGGARPDRAGRLRRASFQIAGSGTTFSAPSIFVRPNGEADIVAHGSGSSVQYLRASPNLPWQQFQIAP